MWESKTTLWSRSTPFFFYVILGSKSKLPPRPPYHPRPAISMSNSVFSIISWWHFYFNVTLIKIKEILNQKTIDLRDRFLSTSGGFSINIITLHWEEGLHCILLKIYALSNAWRIPFDVWDYFSSDGFINFFNVVISQKIVTDRLDKNKPHKLLNLHSTTPPPSSNVGDKRQFSRFPVRTEGECPREALTTLKNTGLVTKSFLWDNIIHRVLNRSDYSTQPNQATRVTWAQIQPEVMFISRIILRALRKHSDEMAKAWRKGQLGRSKENTNYHQPQKVDGKPVVI